MSMQVILLERVENLGGLGEVVNVKPGYARNYLIPQQKALRATKDNIAYFEAQKKEIEKQNEAKRKDAEKEAKKLDGLKVALIRHASESGQLYGSVTARDISEVVGEESGVKVPRSGITLHDALKTVGLFTVTIALHPEVKVDVTINIARSADEAKTQEKTGKALVAGQNEDLGDVIAEADEAAADAKAALMDAEALEADKQRKATEKAKKAEADAKAAEKAAKNAEAKAAAKAEAEEASDDAGEESEEAKDA